MTKGDGGAKVQEKMWISCTSIPQTIVIQSVTPIFWKFSLTLFKRAAPGNLPRDRRLRQEEGVRLLLLLALRTAQTQPPPPEAYLKYTLSSTRWRPGLGSILDTVSKDTDDTAPLVSVS